MNATPVHRDRKLSRRVKGGRPVRLNVYVTRQLRAEVNASAAKAGLTTGEWLLRIVEAVLRPGSPA